MIISNESMDFNNPKDLNDPQLFDDPQLYDDQLEVWTLIIQKSTVIPSSAMVLFIDFVIVQRSIGPIVHFPHQNWGGGRLLGDACHHANSCTS